MRTFLPAFLFPSPLNLNSTFPPPWTSSLFPSPLDIFSFPLPRQGGGFGWGWPFPLAHTIAIPAKVDWELCAGGRQRERQFGTNIRPIPIFPPSPRCSFFPRPSSARVHARAAYAHFSAAALNSPYFPLRAKSKNHWARPRRP